MDSLLEFLKQEKPDIITSQETFDEHDESLPPFLRTINQIKEATGLEYHFFDPAFKNLIKGFSAMKGNAIFSKFPIIKTSSLFLCGTSGEYAEGDFSSYPILQRKLQGAEIKFNDKILNVYNLQGIWGTHGNDTDDRLKVSQKIIDEIKDKPKVILAGDFNVDQESKSITNIEKYLSNVFKGELSSTFNMKRKKEGGYASAVVDFVFVSKDIKVLNHQCPDIDVSDHLPLVCELDLPAGRQGSSRS